MRSLVTSLPTWPTGAHGPKCDPATHRTRHDCRIRPRPAGRFTDALPEACVVKSRQANMLFASFGLSSKVGIAMTDTSASDGANSLLVVSGVTGPALDAGVPRGAVVVQFQTEEIPLGFTQDEFGVKLGGLKSANVEYVVLGFDVTFAKENAQLGLKDNNSTKGVRRGPQRGLVYEQT